MRKEIQIDQPDFVKMDLSQGLGLHTKEEWGDLVILAVARCIWLKVAFSYPEQQEQKYLGLSQESWPERLVLLWLGLQIL